MTESEGIITSQGAPAEAPLRPRITIRFFTDEKCFGPGVAMLLSGVDEHHSLRAAASALGMAYSKAWKVMRNAERILGFPLLSSTKGGKSGGGAILTPKGERLLYEYTAYVNEIEGFSNDLFDKRFAWLACQD